MKILAIETSCDETGMALIEGSPSTGSTGSPQASSGRPDKIQVMANLVRSQIETHRPYGGVVPNIAKREHAKALPLLWQKLVTGSRSLAADIDLIAVTEGPGLSPCLWAGIEFAKKLSADLDVPLAGVNHLKGHIYISFQPTADQPQAGQTKIEYPLLALIVSGGHTELVWSGSPGKFEIIGQTRDDAAGEAFDKVARLLGLGFPGGPEISRVAEGGDPNRFDLPRPMIDSGDFDFSFAGLKTAVVYLVKGIGGQKPVELNEKNIADIAACFQKAAVDVLITKTIRAARNLSPKTLILGGGVAANELLRSELERSVTLRLGSGQASPKLILPDPKLTTDNALMIALAAWYERDKLKPTKDLKARPNLKITEAS